MLLSHWQAWPVWQASPLSLLRAHAERAVILCEQGASLHFHFDQANMEPFFSSQAGDGGILADTPTLEQLEERYLRKIMAMTQGRVRGEHGAAALLHMKIPP